MCIQFWFLFFSVFVVVDLQDVFDSVFIGDDFEFEVIYLLGLKLLISDDDVKCGVFFYEEVMDLVFEIKVKGLDEEVCKK